MSFMGDEFNLSLKVWRKQLGSSLMEFRQVFFKMKKMDSDWN